MPKSEKPPARWTRRLPILLAAGLVVVALFISLFRDMGIVGTWRLRNTEKQLRYEVEKLRQENARLKREVEDLRRNPSVIEEEARKLGLIKEKEKVIVVPQRQEDPPQAPVKPAQNRP